MHRHIFVLGLTACLLLPQSSSAKGNASLLKLAAPTKDESTVVGWLINKPEKRVKRFYGHYPETIKVRAKAGVHGFGVVEKGNGLKQLVTRMYETAPDGATYKPRELGFTPEGRHIWTTLTSVKGGVETVRCFAVKKKGPVWKSTTVYIGKDSTEKGRTLHYKPRTGSSPRPGAAS